MLEWDDNDFPLAYLVTFRCYGTWLHGDERGSVDIHGKNIYGTPDIAPNPKLKRLMQRSMKQPPLVLDEKQRRVIEEAIREVCHYRAYTLHAVNVRSNHIHAVVSAQSKPEPIINAFKAYATKKLREHKLLPPEVSPWSRGKSRCYLWKPRHVALAIEYVLYGQGDIPFEIEADE